MDDIQILTGWFYPNGRPGNGLCQRYNSTRCNCRKNRKVLDEVTEIAKKIEGVENVTTLAGYSIVTEIAGASYGMAMINLKDWKDRNISVNEFIAELSKKTKGISDAQIEIFAPPTVPGFGNTSGFELRLLTLGWRYCQYRQGHQRIYQKTK